MYWTAALARYIQMHPGAVVVTASDEGLTAVVSVAVAGPDAMTIASRVDIDRADEFKHERIVRLALLQNFGQEKKERPLSMNRFDIVRQALRILRRIHRQSS